MQRIRKPELYNKVQQDTVKRQRYDLYVDESGQDTKGELFVVAVVATENSDEFRQYCESLEQSSGKGKVKWRSAQKMRRLDYLRSIMLDNSIHKFILFYRVFRRITDYDSATIDGIASAIRKLRPLGSHVYVHVDGLPKSKRHVYKTRLRQLSCPVKKVTTVKDENEPIIRLADALAGASAALEKYQNEELRPIFSQAEESGLLISFLNRKPPQ